MMDEIKMKFLNHQAPLFLSDVTTIQRIIISTVLSFLMGIVFSFFDITKGRVVVMKIIWVCVILHEGKQWGWSGGVILIL